MCEPDAEPARLVSGVETAMRPVGSTGETRCRCHRQGVPGWWAGGLRWVYRRSGGLHRSCDCTEDRKKQRLLWMKYVWVIGEHGVRDEVVNSRTLLRREGVAGLKQLHFLRLGYRQQIRSAEG